jgi:hypothetical protein
MPLNGIRLEIAGLLLQPELDSLVRSGKEKFWGNTTKFLGMLGSTAQPAPNPGLFPNDGSHYRLAQVFTIWSIFGIAAPAVPRVTLTQLVGEIVEHRNAIAHGRGTPEEIGRRYSKDDILGKIDGLLEICMHISLTLENHCKSAANLAR